MWSAFIFLLISGLSYASPLPTHRPASFMSATGKAVFVDFTEASYQLTYDIPQRKASVLATIKLTLPEEGMPVFDLIEEPSSLKVNGEDVKTLVISTPSFETQLRQIQQTFPEGDYELEIEVPLKNLVKFEKGEVRSAFWVTDLEDRFYLERYIPTNLEYDSFAMTFDVQYIGATVPHHIFANGKVTWTSKSRAVIEFPSYFTVNSLFFHTTPESSVNVLRFDFPSISGQAIPVTLYTAASSNSSSTLSTFKKETTKVMKELEGDYGAFRHASVTIYNADLSSMGLGGMEYAGATVTNINSLGHELFHSYFARGLVPANGNAGWIDESLASWRDNGYNRLTTLTGGSRMGAHPAYTRSTDTDAYGFGARLMAHLNHRFNDKGGLKPFMNNLLVEKLFVPIDSEEFIQAMEKFYSDDLKELFRKTVFGNKAASPRAQKHGHPIHRKMGAQELFKLL